MQYSDEELLDEIRRVATVADSDGAPTLQQFRDHSSIADTTILRRFDSWQAAVSQAGFEPRSPTTRIADADLKTALRELCDEVGRIPTGTQMNELGPYSRSTYQEHFGSWSAALDATFEETSEAGAHVSNKELLAEIRRVADEHSTPPRFADMRKHGDHQARTYIKRFGSWREAVAEAGIDPPEPQRVPTADLIADLERLRDELDKRPTSTDVVEHSEYGLATYQRRFGSWGEAVDTALPDE